MKTITTGIVLVTCTLIVPAAPAAAQDNVPYQVQRIIDSALTLAADALDNLVDDRAARQRGARPPREDRGPEYTEKFEKTVRLGRNGRLELENLSGDVDITGGGGDDVKITATKVIHSTNESTARTALHSTTIDVSERTGAVRITAEPSRGRSGSVEVNYVITVPSGASLELKTYSGDVTVRSVAGAIHLNALSGDIVVKDARPADVDIESVSGDVSLEQIDSDRVRVKSLSGDVVFKGKLSKTGRYDLSTNSGDVQVVTDSGASFDLEAQTFSGDVSSDFAMKLRGSVSSSFSGKGPRRSGDIRGTVNDGGALLSLHSFSGDILVNKR